MKFLVELYFFNWLGGSKNVYMFLCQGNSAQLCLTERDLCFLSICHWGVCETGLAEECFLPEFAALGSIGQVQFQHKFRRDRACAGFVVLNGF